MEATAAQTLMLHRRHDRGARGAAGLALLWTLEAPRGGRAAGRRDPRGASRAGGSSRASMSLRGPDPWCSKRASAAVSLPEAHRLILRSALEDGRLDAGDLPTLRDAKAELLADDRVLTLFLTEQGGLDHVGGLDRLKDWLAVRGHGFTLTKDYGLDAPRGVLLLIGSRLREVPRRQDTRAIVGDATRDVRPGRDLPLVRGESEARLHQALGTLESMALVVVWIDEIEKGFAASASARDGGVVSGSSGASCRGCRSATATSSSSRPATTWMGSRPSCCAVAGSTKRSSWISRQSRKRCGDGSTSSGGSGTRTTSTSPRLAKHAPGVLRRRGSKG